MHLLLNKCWDWHLFVSFFWSLYLFPFAHPIWVVVLQTHILSVSGKYCFTVNRLKVSEVNFSVDPVTFTLQEPTSREEPEPVLAPWKSVFQGGVILGLTTDWLLTPALGVRVSKRWMGLSALTNQSPETTPFHFLSHLLFNLAQNILLEGVRLPLQPSSPLFPPQRGAIWEDARWH